MAKKRPPRKKPLKITRTNRAKIDPATGRVISRRQFEKKYGRKVRSGPGYSPHKFNKSLKYYRVIRSDYIEKQLSLGKKLALNKDGSVSKRGVMASPEFKKIIRNLKSKNREIKAQAIVDSGHTDKKYEDVLNSPGLDNATHHDEDVE